MIDEIDFFIIKNAAFMRRYLKKLFFVDDVLVRQWVDIIKEDQNTMSSKLVYRIRALTMTLIVWNEKHQFERSQVKIAWFDQQVKAVMRLKLKEDSKTVKKLVEHYKRFHEVINEFLNS